MSQLFSCSGGQDSTFLFLFFSTNRDGMASMNHLVQKDNFYSSFNIGKMGYWCAHAYHLSVPFFGLQSEQKAASWRYSQFLRIQNYYTYTHVLLGKTKQDSIEKFFIHLSRGCTQFNDFVCTLRNVSEKLTSKWVI